MRKLPVALTVALAVSLAACAPENEMEYVDDDTAVVDEPFVDEDVAEEASDARELVIEATETVREMSTDPEIVTLVGLARGILIIPQYGRAAAGIGVRGGEGVLMVRSNGGWSGPAFYDVGGVSIGAQLGAEGGEIAILLMNDEAVNEFATESNFTFTAGADLTIVDYSAQTQGTASDADIVFWSDTEGLFAGLDLAISNINWDDEENPAYYGRMVMPQEILGGTLTPGMEGTELGRVLSGG